MDHSWPVLPLLKQPSIMPSVVLSPRSPPVLSLVVRSETSDSDVAVALIAGEAWAVEETWRRFAPMVLRVSERCLGSKSEAEDVTQEAFQKLFHKASQLRDPNCLRSFVYSFAIRTLKSELRRRKVRNWLSFERPETLEEARSEAADLESRDLLRRFHVLLDRLSGRDRLVFVLRRMEGMTLEEIAAQMALSKSTVKRSLNHATERLSSWVKAEPELLSRLRGGREI